MAKTIQLDSPSGDHQMDKLGREKPGNQIVGLIEYCDDFAKTFIEI